jgi:tetratricopeptide (TPR) repeat protein
MLASMVRNALLLCASVVTIFGLAPQAGDGLRIRGIVHTAKGDPVSHTKVSVEAGGSYQTTDTGQFLIDSLPVGSKPGRPVQLEVEGWLILLPNDGGSGRVYLPDPTEPPVAVKVARKGDRAALLTDTNIENLLFERFFRLETDEDRISGVEGINATRSGRLLLVSLQNGAALGASTETEGFLKEKSEQFSIPLKELETAIESWVKRAESPYAKALAALYRGDYKAAAEYAAKSDSARGAEGEFRRNVVLSYADFKLGRYDEAKEAIDRAMGFHPHDSVLQLNIRVIKGASVLSRLDPKSSPCDTDDPGRKVSISGIVIPPKPGIPFSARIGVEWSDRASDGKMACRNYYTVVARDKSGRLRREVRHNVSADQGEAPLVSFTVFDPEKNLQTQCFPTEHTCYVTSFHYVAPPPDLPAGLSDGGTRYVHREDLGMDTIASLGVVHKREVTTTESRTTGAISVLTSKETWFSPELQFNLKEIRLDPTIGRVVLSIADLKTSDPDPSLFVLPGDFQIIDRR